MSDDLRPAELHELDRANCLALLATQTIGRLVVTEGDGFIVPLNYAVVDDAVIVRADAGSTAATGAGTAVVFEVDAIDGPRHGGWSVVVRGRMEDITDTADDDGLRDRLQSWAPGLKDRWLRIEIDHLTGRWLHGAEQPATSDPRGYL